ncbi:GyrI-like domain-containing protein [Salinibacterium sp. SWN1162]|uniref:GyrI-like domain-containing protein n=1 Tax=Salinibacterium sp. SWN1162 TaxID=2792053 RepID=UPI0018CDB534|nr:GyrI-like domain-containing protein [Salinibacterium sp. SWN1162]MBH0008389.1 GyrI-like domain-containing protein [Salinibacterium sp. SWN1162]
MKTDFKKTLDAYKARHNEFRILDVPPQQYLMVDGHGAPGEGSDYTTAIAALYPVAYTLKFASKALDRDYVVPPLEALWWADDMAAFTTGRDKSQWDWTVMLLTPEWITEQMFQDAVAVVAAKSKTPDSLPADLGKVRLETLAEGLCVQTLHLGPYDDEAEILAQLHDEFIPEQGLRMTGKHHEIYFNDFRKVEASKLRTLLRQPVERA